MPIVLCKTDPRASVPVECRQVQFFLESSCLLVELLQTYAEHPEKRSFRVVNLCLIVARYYIHTVFTAAKESESYSITAFKVLLKSISSTESPSI